MWQNHENKINHINFSIYVYSYYSHNSDSLILTHSGDIWQKYFNPGEFWPQFERIVAYF